MSSDPDHDSSPRGPNDKPTEQPTGWLTHVVLACVTGVAATGMVLGFYGTENPTHQAGIVQASSGEGLDGTVPQAISYTQMKNAPAGPNVRWTTNWPKADADPTQFYGSSPASEQDRATDNAKRAQRRAFSGAPPVVPHAIDQQNASSCLTCHGQGLKVGQVVAPRMSHEAYANCTQCHIESTNRALPPTGEARAPANEFVGLAAPGPGERAWPGAPPVIPHTTWMRENCVSCHGSLAQKGLRTSHPWRGSCVQCHGTSAELNQWRLVSDHPSLPKLQGTDP